jgi:hypothetical protein
MPSALWRGEGNGVSELLSPCGAWRFTVRRLGRTAGATDTIGVLARLEADGTVTVFAGGPAGEPGLGGWKAAGPGRLVVIVEWFVRGASSPSAGRVSVRAAAELSADGRTCQARLQWRYLDLAGKQQGEPETGEADGARLEP